MDGARRDGGADARAAGASDFRAFRGSGCASRATDRGVERQSPFETRGIKAAGGVGGFSAIATMVKVRPELGYFDEDYSKCLSIPLRPGLQQVDIFARQCVRLTKETTTRLRFSFPPDVPVPKKSTYDVEAVNLCFLNRDGDVAVNAAESPRCKLKIFGLSSHLTLLPGDLICTISVRDLALAPYDSRDNLEEDSEDEEAIEELEQARRGGYWSGPEEEERRSKH